MTRDAFVVRLPGLRLVDDRLQLLERRDLQAEVVERGRVQVRVAGQQVDELAERAGVEDQRVAGLAGVVAFGPAEHVAVEVEQLGAAARRRAARDPC